LHRSRSTANTSPTALISACGRCRFSNDVSRYPHGRRYTWERHPYYEDLALVQAMLLHSADIQARYVQQYSALFAAVQADRLRTVEMLLQHGTNINTQDKDGETPLMWAVEMDSPEMVECLLAHGANANVQDEGRSTALQYCVASYSSENILRQLLRCGANPDVSNRRGATPCQMAQQKQCFDVVRLLKQYGAK
jgi:ankyrin repeat protein